ncbi:MAG: NAD(P)-dependent oxidoreductase [Rhodospirillaceae bacterium]|nr:NAD(P)-dependent oxidoreductase [Rhodospirillaceae bacterium]MDE0617793.1 NAD(P)-dependent oxidoreductase [Rhodospirillaceae bacterium]
MNGGVIYGFIGLGNMGGPMAANLAAFLAAGGYPSPVVFDAAGTADRAPGGAACAPDAATVAQQADLVFLSLPDGSVVQAVAEAIAQTPERRASALVDLSTVGIDAAREIDGLLQAHGMAFADCPVSGGRIGAQNATISLMWAGPADLLEVHRPALESFAGNVFHVGDRPGQGQALKLLNNFLSATITAATAEALLFGLTQGLDLKTMLDVVNVSTGGSAASREKFVRRVLPGTFDSGFDNALMAKDLALFADSLRRAGAPEALTGATEALWREFRDAMPASDHMEVYCYIRDRGAGQGQRPAEDDTL